MIVIDDEAETKYYYHFDGVGSVIALSDVNSVIVERYSYDVFGEPNTTSSLGNPYLFTGRRYDNETALYYYRARYYDYYIGRFLQPDPLSYDAGLNLYSYCGNNPLAWIDPFGLSKMTPEQLYSKLGSYGSPYAVATIGRPSSRSLYVLRETKDIKVYGIVAGALTPDYGIANALGTGSGFAGSLKLDTYRRYGSSKISYHELSIFETVKEGLVSGDSGSLYGFKRIENAKTAKRILIANPDLMERAIEHSRPSRLRKILEFIAEVFTRQPER